MKSILVLLVEHGETLDPLTQLVGEVSDLVYNVPDARLVDWTNRVDVPANVDMSFWVRDDMVIGLPSRDHPHVTFPGDGVSVTPPEQPFNK